MDELTFIPPSARAVLLKSPTQSLELVSRGFTANAPIIPVAKPALVSKHTRTRGKVLAKLSCISLRNANFSFVAVSVGATSPSHFAEGRHLQPRGTHWRGVAKPALISKPADAAARKLASHIRSQAARRDRHDAVCRRVAAACRALHSDVKRDAPLWRLGIELKGPGRRAVDVSVRRDEAWSFVEVTVRAFAGDASMAEAAIDEKRAKYADLRRVHVLALDAVTGRAYDDVFADLEAAGLVADGAALADACALAVVTRCAAPLLPRKRRRAALGMTDYGRVRKSGRLRRPSNQRNEGREKLRFDTRMRGLPTS